MNTARKGRAAEHRTRNVLEGAGYVVVRAAASKGPCDLVAWNGAAIRFVAVKSGTARLSAVEREQFQLLPRPTNSLD